LKGHLAASKYGVFMADDAAYELECTIALICFCGVKRLVKDFPSQLRSRGLLELRNQAVRCLKAALTFVLGPNVHDWIAK